MCGIAGIFQLKTDNIINIRKILEKIKHRGPDHTGVWSNKNITLGSVRLKVVDLNDKSNQPFISRNKKFVIVFNGEIYNYKYLKKKFNVKTYTQSDTEVIVEIFSKIGPKIFNNLDGMFAIAIYDIENLKLYIARDGIGIKPLYYFITSKKLIFSSEIKGITSIQKNIDINNNSIINFVKWGALDHSSKTWYKNINSLDHGSYIQINKNLEINKFKFFKLNQKKIMNNEISYKFSKLLEKSVKAQSQTVRSIGTNLSGGVDSSIVTSFLKNYRKDIKSYTFGYNEEKYDERPYAKKISSKLNIKNYTSLSDFKSINKNFINTLIMEDEPFTSFRQVSHHQLYNQFKKDGSTVILESSGGDEIGGGYTGFIWPYYLDQIKEIGIKKARENLNKIMKSHGYSSLKIEKFILAAKNNQKYYGSTTSDGQKIIDDKYLVSSFEKNNDLGPPKYEKPFESNLLNSQYIELFHTKLQRGLRYVDRASSGSGREARVPLLNRDIIEFCFSIPNNYKIYNGELRWFMKQSLKYIKNKNLSLPNKRSIADPQRIWMRNEMKKNMLSILKSKKFINRGIFNPKVVSKYYNSFIKNQSAHSLGIFQIFITELWIRLFFDNNSIDYKNVALDQFIKETNN